MVRARSLPAASRSSARQFAELRLTEAAATTMRASLLNTGIPLASGNRRRKTVADSGRLRARLREDQAGLRPGRGSGGTQQPRGAVAEGVGHRFAGSCLLGRNQLTAGVRVEKLRQSFGRSDALIGILSQTRSDNLVDRRRDGGLQLRNGVRGGREHVTADALQGVGVEGTRTG